jgi:hypothetical protein
MTVLTRVLGAGLSLSLAACATGTVVFAPVAGDHPADAAARVPAFRPAPDPLLAEPSPSTAAEAAAPTEHAGHGSGMHRDEPKGSHAQHGESGAPTGHADGHSHGEAPKPHEEGASPSDAVSTEDRLVREYLTLVQALAKDDLQGAKSAAEHAHAAAEALAKTAHGDLADAASTVAAAISRNTASIEDVRRDLKALSEAMATLVRHAPPTRDAAPRLVNVYCPMAGASWLQAQAEVANPYFGAKMPRCGRVTETIETRPVGEK